MSCEIESATIRADILRAIENEPSATLGETYEKVIETIDNQEAIPNFKNIESTMYRKRKQMMPPSCHSFSPNRFNQSQLQLPVFRSAEYYTHWPLPWFARSF